VTLKPGVAVVQSHWKCRLLKVIQTGIDRLLGCSFLFAFHSNYGSILDHFRDKARYWSKIVIFFVPPLHSKPPLWRLRRRIAFPFSTEKPEWWVYRMVRKIWRHDYSFRQNPRTWRTDTQTPHDGIGSAYAWHRAAKKSAIRGTATEDALGIVAYNVHYVLIEAKQFETDRTIHSVCRHHYTADLDRNALYKQLLCPRTGNSWGRVALNK